MNQISISQMKINTVSFIIMSLAIVMINGCAHTPTLYSAVENGNIEEARVMLKAGADINMKNAALYRAAWKGRIDIVKLLLDNGADVNAAMGGGRTPLSVAAEGRHSDIIKFLISKGADLDGPISMAEEFAASGGGNRAHWAATAKLLTKFAPKKEVAQTATTVSSSNNEAQTSSAIKSDVDEVPPNLSLPAQSSYAVVIGIENYRSLPKSDFSKKDANLMKSYLKSLGFQERNIDLLTDERASKTDIEKSLEAWLPNRVKKDSTVFIYYSGHGSPDPSSGEAYIVPYDGDPNYLAVTGYSMKRLYQVLEKMNAKEVVVVLDSCFSGAGERSVLAQGARPLVMMADAIALSSNMAVITATQGSQISTSSPEKGHGIFTYYFLKAIKDGKKNLADIYESIKPQVEDEAKLLNVQQSPSLNPAPEKLAGRFILRQ